ncbi:hypothetical protein AQUCO_01400241v1 [Aquilegia coerulea]|uniref:Response regulatory domain-containing protein n=1 Tax=Aquilegia coerulea TaxID=218851 RepID=A0A2G5DVA4_AQUCA|nr:hypothetical protein AQUCO_01400241v1 [Aquilegia coerulea]
MGFQANHEDTKHQLPQQQNFHVLAVDDSSLDRKLLEKLLTVSSYHVTCVDSGDKALEYLGLLDDISSDSSTSSSSSISQQRQETKVNLIMTDYSMPGMTGYDLLQRVKKSSWKDVPVVVMSSENVPSRINMCLEGGAEEFLLKPVQLSDVKRLQPHLMMKSFVSNNCTESDNNSNDSGIDSKSKAISSDDTAC